MGEPADVPPAAANARARVHLDNIELLPRVREELAAVVANGLMKQSVYDKVVSAQHVRVISGVEQGSTARSAALVHSLSRYRCAGVASGHGWLCRKCGWECMVAAPARPLQHLMAAGRTTDGSQSVANEGLRGNGHRVKPCLPTEVMSSETLHLLSAEGRPFAKRVLAAHDHPDEQIPAVLLDSPGKRKSPVHQTQPSEFHAGHAGISHHELQVQQGRADLDEEQRCSEQASEEREEECHC